MPYSREQIEKNLVPNEGTNIHALIRGKKYMGRDVPDGYFVVQDWCLSQGVALPGSGIPDLTHILQGVEYFIQAAIGKYPDEMVLTPDEIRGMMFYLNQESEFDGGALIQFPELQEVLKRELIKLPKGSAVIEAIRSLPGNQDLFT